MQEQNSSVQLYIHLDFPPAYIPFPAGGKEMGLYKDWKANEL